MRVNIITKVSEVEDFSLYAYILAERPRHPVNHSQRLI